jgi:serine/threonine-protein kinase
MLIADKYRVERVLGQGAMGVVVSATHLTLQQTVAIKVLRRELVADTGIVARFLQEARAQARIQGDHVVRVLDVADFPEVGPAIVMEFLAGEDLQAHVDEQGPLAVPVAVDFVLQAAEALAQAHSFGLVHRDLKPQNLFLSAHPDGSPLIKVLDFGISKVTLAPDDTRREGLTTGGSLLGSPQYMSPEQITDPRGVTHKSDLWSLGVILYELLTAKMPFDGQNVVSILTAISLEEPRHIREHRPDLPQGLADTVMRCLQKVPAHRPGDIAELAEGLVVDAASEARANRVAHIQRRYSYRPGPPPSGVEEPLASALRAPRLPVLVPSVPPPSVALPAAAPPAATRASDPGQLEWASPTVVPPPPVTGRKRRAWARASMAAAAGAAISFSAIVGVRWVPNHAFARSASPPTGLVAPPPPPVESAPRLDIPEPVAVEVAPLPTPAAATPDAAAPQRIKPKPRPAPAKVAEPDSPPADAPAPAPVPAPPAEATPPSAD